MNKFNSAKLNPVEIAAAIQEGTASPANVEALRKEMLAPIANLLINREDFPTFSQYLERQGAQIDSERYNQGMIRVVANACRELLAIIAAPTRNNSLSLPSKKLRVVSLLLTVKETCKDIDITKLNLSTEELAALRQCMGDNMEIFDPESDYFKESN